ncbi:MAG: hypothetical protein AAB599_01940 [Patescibacteria group bacterium]
MAEAGTETKVITPPARPEPTAFASQKEEDGFINTFREWTESAPFRDLDKTRKELIDNLHPINQRSEGQRRV